ncbi:MAG TPA: Gfo/Idh/MocA family oxidoreductase [Tepidisphaeraceae bacterium]|jgi:predicted dehydrogenase
MAETTRIGIIGAGWPGVAHARGYRAAGGFRIVAVADLIPARRKGMMQEFQIPTEYTDAAELIADKEIDAVSLCVPNYLHAPLALAAFKAGKHVVCEMPPALSSREARQMEAAAERKKRVLLLASQRRFGPGEQASRQAVAKQFAGDIYHARATWMRSRAIPIGTGWYPNKTKSGGGALIDLGSSMLDLAWSLIGQPRPISVFGVTHRRFGDLLPPPAEPIAEVEDAAFGMIKFEGNKSLELAATWAINQSPNQNGTACRLYGTHGAVEVYTPAGAVLFRNFGPKGEAKQTPLKPPKVVHHAAMLRHFRECILGTATPMVGGREAVVLMQMIEALYKSAETGKSVDVK